MGHLARDCPNRGTRDDSGINLKRAFGSFVVMTGDRDVSSLVLTTTPQQEIVQYSDFNMSHVPVVIWLTLLVSVEQFLCLWCHQPCVVKCKARLFCWDLDGTTVIFHVLLQRSNAPPRTVLITENGMKSDQGFSLTNSSQHFESFDESYIFSTVHSMFFTFSGSLCRVGSLCDGRR